MLVCPFPKGPATQVSLELLTEKKHGVSLTHWHNAENSSVGVALLEKRADNKNAVKLKLFQGVLASC